jgi:hypothetical protein
LRVTGAELGYDTDLDFVFPENTGVFKAGGDLAYHHGGTSLQELVVPVITLRLQGRKTSPPPPNVIAIVQAPELIATRAFSVKLANLGTLELRVRPVVIADGREIAKASLVIPDKGDTLDTKACTLLIAAGSQPAVAFFLTSDEPKSLKIVVFDEATDKPLCETAEIPVRLGM